MHRPADAGGDSVRLVGVWNPWSRGPEEVRLLGEQEEGLVERTAATSSWGRSSSQHPWPTPRPGPQVVRITAVHLTEVLPPSGEACREQRLTQGSGDRRLSSQRWSASTLTIDESGHDAADPPVVGELGDHLGYTRRSQLHIWVQHEEGAVCACALGSSVDRRAVADVLRELEDLEPRMSRSAQQVERPIGRGVVDHHGLHRSHRARPERSQETTDLCPAVEGDDYRATSRGTSTVIVTLPPPFRLLGSASMRDGRRGSLAYRRATVLLLSLSVGDDAEAPLSHA